MNTSSYFKRIGYKDLPRVDLETLRKLHRLHTLSIPFENLNPFLSLSVPLDLPSLEGKLIAGGRGGYCFEQNLVFSQALKEIGFEVRGLAARVLRNLPEDTITRRSHMLLAVRLGNETFIADVGFGGLTMPEPLALKPGVEQVTTHETYRVEKLGDDFKLQAKIQGEWKTLYRFDLQEQFQIDYEVANFYVSTHPSSHFLHELMVTKPSAGGRLALNNNQFTFYPKEGEAQRRRLNSVEEIKDVLQQEFRLNLSGLDALEERLNTVIHAR